MIVFLLIVSFIIDGLLILALGTMMKKIRLTEELERRQKQVASEIEDLFTSYLMEIKEENKRMEEWFTMSKAVPSPEETKNAGSEVSTEQESVTSYAPPEPDIVENYEPSLHAKVFDMKEKGCSIEEIARKLHKGKTEIELLYKFYKN
ncbi:DUF6115 domain-containing protein [Halobacillus karajensis]|uniref:Uncharacterized protein n=1 Tax=Halobacillus karajensis TaxID=195088 RepID=A0A024P289_9BACI|nr:hypothetical protein [Halobacillus karajensis]CDQ19718.1 hypothetical protein BN982_02020 [Halobacillus karajensis]CDQ22178.1 hypothetical protein BN983_00381 [Halobacillus karajensis]CDQ28019.1 hypothetical protein BN981_02308 [Halobacillus karajensis]